MHVFVREDWKKRRNYVGKPVNHGAQLVFVVHYYSSGERSVSASPLSVYHDFLAGHIITCICASLANEPRELDDEDEDAMDEDGAVTDDEDGWRGTIRRRLWKTTCMRAALNVSARLAAFSIKRHSESAMQPALSATERALYAALAPAPQTAAPLHAACRTWADRLWALVCVACEERVSAGLARLEDASFWEGGLQAVEGPKTQTQQSETGPGLQNRSMSQAMVEDDAEEEEWEKEILGALEGLGKIAVEEG